MHTKCISLFVEKYLNKVCTSKSRITLVNLARFQTIHFPDIVERNLNIYFISSILDFENFKLKKFRKIMLAKSKVLTKFPPIRIQKHIDKSVIRLTVESL